MSESSNKFGLDNITIGFIGGGNMARAIAEGVLRKGLLKSTQILVASPSDSNRSNWEALAISTVRSNDFIINKADVIFLAFKPQQLEEAFKNISHQLQLQLPSKLFVSVLAGTSCESVYNVISTKVQLNARVIRVMPNTAVLVCEGCTAVSPHSSATPHDVELVRKLFLAVGRCEVVPESLISAVTGLTGSGPAYIYTVIEALSDGGVKQGLPRNLSTTFAAQTVLGAAKMVLETNRHPGELKDDVCSAGGTTIYGIHALEKGNLRATLINAVEAAVNRGDEISKLSRKS